MSEEDKKLIEEMKDNCIKQANYVDVKAMNKYNALRNLQQENQQLKEELNKYKRIYRENPTLYDEIAPYIINECNLENKLKQYKSVLDEIREYVNRQEVNSIGSFFADTPIGKDLLQILDKAKGVNK